MLRRGNVNSAAFQRENIIIKTCLRGEYEKPFIIRRKCPSYTFLELISAPKNTGAEAMFIAPVLMKNVSCLKDGATFILGALSSLDEIRPDNTGIPSRLSRRSL
jgi:hypothetical protein